ncbi:SCO family protein [Ramlibacter alkalitolerans]|uniref:SCO family protein n=1 Tax=Ramlibacter alkalitolerans TaxID=2039631 RepID=A0ABS1JQL6_9BURK|nr:SCO family protein [Ramlibacter alkalitolerans]MBL0426498.1 SCO family protein [Ramlibacter alkalitolerans]
MNTSLLRRREALLSLATLAVAPAWAHGTGHEPLPDAPTAPGDSVYRLDAKLQDQDGRSFALASLQGTPVLASMFYTSCDMVCPMIFESIHANLRSLPAREREAVRVLMVSFDPARDTQAVLKKTAEQHNCDSRWRLARCDEATARKVAAVLGIQYRRLGNGEYNHSSTIDVLDAQGRIVARTGKLGAADPAVAAALHKLPLRAG